MKNSVKNQIGFTLLEVLIATMISAIVLAAVMEVFGSNYKSYILQNDVADMQENLRVGMSFLDRDVTMIGSGMIGVDKPGGFQIMKIIDGKLYANQAYPLTFQNNAGDIDGLTVNPLTNLFPPNVKGGSDRLIIRYNKLDEGDCGEERNKAGILACDRLPRVTLKAPKAPSSAEADVNEVLVYSNNCKVPYDPNVCACNDSTLGCYSVFPRWNDDCYCGDTVYDAPQPKFFALITAPATSEKGARSDIFVLTSVNGKDQLQNRPVFSLDNKVMNDYDAGSKISFFTMKTYKEVMYYVQDRQLRQRITTYPDPGDTVLNPQTQDQPLVENIDDLQFAFGLDTSVPTDDIIDEWINEKDLTPAQSIQVRMVRINLLGRTARPNSTFYTGLDNVMRAATGTSSDKLEDHTADEIEKNSPVQQKERYFMRKLIQTTVKVRSLGL